MAERSFPCPICGEILEKHEGKAECMFCGEKEEADYICPNGHFRCEECRLAGPKEIIERTCKNYDGTEPIELAPLIMKHSSFNAHGIEHHLLVAPVILTICRNSGIDVSSKKIKTAMKRLEDIPYGACGSRGACGACESAGVAVSLITGASFRSGEERSLALRTTSNSLKAIAEMGGPRCCKQSVYASIEQAISILKEEYDLDDIEDFKCPFAGDIEGCKEERCIYYG
ncbi:MAG: hypothetical protein KGY76_01135 [Candidatus Thermoplasmatota archaeon]|nr:hypothetical protein [Candidatus Thermoplasmatota archaeon]